MAKHKDQTLPVLTHILGWLTSFVGPLIILLTARDKDLKKHAKRALNWQFSLIIYMIISVILMLVLIGFVLIVILAILNIVFSIMAAVKAGHGEHWRYPMSINFFDVK